MPWQPSLGAWPEGDGVRFRVWAPVAQAVELILESSRNFGLEKEGGGTWTTRVAGAHVGNRYRYRIDGQGPFPDPASRFQPEGVHGPSEVVDPNRFGWSDAGWRGRQLEELVLYEIHVGTFSPAGTFDAVRERLPELAELGVTAIELMPLADFPGQRNWGYDGVDLFAPARCYGRPDDLRRLIDAAHRLGLAVLVDAVYNHLGPDGNYLGVYSPFWFSQTHHTDWGQALNFDGEHSNRVRQFFIENALHWVHEYHADGLRLDATHVIMDDGPRHFLQELTAQVKASAPERHIHVIAEDDRNLARLVQPEAAGGWGLDGVWADDFHHEMRRLLAGDHESYYRDYQGTVVDLAATLRHGWFYCGQASLHQGKPRGTDPAGIPPRRFVICIQNHDQVGNRALGDRLHHQVDLAAWRAASALLLAAPQTPLLFMGQEWAASTPFQFFTDHNPELGKLVTEGRRKEFKHFSAFTDPAARDRIPDPQAESTFLASKLDWTERHREPHAALLRLYRELLRLRQNEPALRSTSAAAFRVEANDPGGVVLLRQAADSPPLLVVVQLKGTATMDLRRHSWAAGPWQVLLTTEDAAFAPDACLPAIDLGQGAPVVQFQRPGAVFLKAS
jgi:maltooligosyltrehalose trehalohydrolase